MLCYVMLCYVMLCYVVLCYVMLCYVMLCMYVCMYVYVCYRSRFFHFTNSLDMIQGIHPILVQASRHRSCAMCARFIEASRLDRWIGVLWENLWETMDTMENPWKTMENH